LTAAVSAGQSASGHGLRPFDSGRDLMALADLIEIGFAENLDRSGRRMVRGLRSMGRLGWLGGLLSRWLLPPAGNPRGFVWEEEGVVLGNASLLPVTGYLHRWVMANVVVLPKERRKGIGRSLVNKSIEYARAGGAREIILQVDHDNIGATSLYHSLGFSSSSPRATWVGRMSQVNLPTSINPYVRRRKTSEWRQQWQLAQSLHPEGLVWPYPSSAAYFRPSVWQQHLGLHFDRHWVWSEGDRLIGSISLRRGYEPGNLRLILLVDEKGREKIEGELIAASLGPLQPFGDVIMLDYPAGVAAARLRQIGFLEQRRLVWMRLKL
jgi:ribosomal protein S18 acetylase RimI-like enzyme